MSLGNINRRLQMKPVSPRHLGSAPSPAVSADGRESIDSLGGGAASSLGGGGTPGVVYSPAEYFTPGGQCPQPSPTEVCDGDSRGTGGSEVGCTTPPPNKEVRRPTAKTPPRTVSQQGGGAGYVAGHPGSPPTSPGRSKHSAFQCLGSQKAATTIQERYRSYLVRKQDRLEQEREMQAATTVQEWFRSYLVRKQDRLEKEREVQAATIIQALGRGYLVQKQDLLEQENSINFDKEEVGPVVGGVSSLTKALAVPGSSSQQLDEFGGRDSLDKSLEKSLDVLTSLQISQYLEFLRKQLIADEELTKPHKPNPILVAPLQKKRVEDADRREAKRSGSEEDSIFCFARKAPGFSEGDMRFFRNEDGRIRAQRELEGVKEWLQYPDRYENLCVEIPGSLSKPKERDGRIEARQARIEERILEYWLRELEGELDDCLRSLYAEEGGIDLTDEEFKDIVNNVMDMEESELVKKNQKRIRRELVKIAKEKWARMQDDASGQSNGICQVSSLDEGPLRFKKEKF